MNSETEIKLEAMRTDDDNVRVLSFPVTPTLMHKLDDQRRKLDEIDPAKSGKERYRDARESGCFAAVAKGAKDRALKSDQIFVPGSELQNGNGQVRISALKATMPVPAGVHVKSITFVREGEVWAGQLEVKEA